VRLLKSLFKALGFKRQLNNEFGRLIVGTSQAPLYL